jgi:hypothetical protein
MKGLIMAMFFAYFALLVCKSLKLNNLIVEAAGVALKTLKLLIPGMPELA